MTQRLVLISVVTFMFFAGANISESGAQAQTASNPRPLNLDLPIFDAPSSPRGEFPSMAQSLALTRTFYDAAHWGLESGLGLEPRSNGWFGFGSRLGFLLTDLALLMELPLGQAWMHEEWHRAVMSHRAVSSYNDVYNLNFGSQVINVSHETDEALTRLKHDHNEDQVRLAAAGMESELVLRDNMERDTFFDNSTAYRSSVYINIAVSTIGYMRTCNSNEADTITDKSNTKEGSDISKRDFIGLDCNGWIRDLNRPNEPYAARGVHYSGVGINRYTTYSDLDQDEKNFLDFSTRLSHLNLVDPFLLGLDAFHGQGVFGERSAKYNANLSTKLTSFGTDLGANVMYASPYIKSNVVMHGYRNFARWFPGLEFNIYDLRPWNLQNYAISLRANVWQQPKNFAFRTDEAMAGGLLGLRFDSRQYSYNPYFALVGKTKGWVAGEVEQDRNLQTIVGITHKFGGLK